MKKTIMILMISSLMGLTGCIETEDIKDNALSKETQSVLDEGSDEGSKAMATPESKTKDVLDHLANQEFLIQGEHLSSADDETVIEFGKAFINLYNGAVAEQEKVSFEKYISNKNLEEFTDKMLELTQRQDVQGGNAIHYGLENKFEQVTLRHIKDNVYYLELPFQHESSSMGSRMLITAVNNALKIVDLYFGSKDGVDTYATGHPAEREMNDPDLWKNEEWVKRVFDKLEEFSGMLDA